MIGKIYMIKSKQTNKVYIGSTVDTLNRRFGKHKSDKTCTSREILKYDDAEIELLECYECENKKQLERHEGEYIRQYNCVNERISGRTELEWYEDNKEAILERNREYYQENKEAITKQRKERYQQNKEIIAKKAKEYYEKNKEAINEKSKEKITCECGTIYRKSDKARHLKTKKHIKFVEIEK